MNYRRWEAEIARWRAMPDPPREGPYPPAVERRPVLVVDLPAPEPEGDLRLAHALGLRNPGEFDGWENPIIRSSSPSSNERGKGDNPPGNVAAYEGESTVCYGCGADTVPRRWPQTRLCWPCIHGPPARYEYGGVVYNDGGRSFRPRYGCCRTGECWIPPDDLPEGLKPMFRTPPDKPPAAPRHWNRFEVLEYREWFHRTAKQVIRRQTCGQFDGWEPRDRCPVER